MVQTIHLWLYSHHHPFYSADWHGGLVCCLLKSQGLSKVSKQPSHAAKRFSSLDCLQSLLAPILKGCRAHDVWALNVSMHHLEYLIKKKRVGNISTLTPTYPKLMHMQHGVGDVIGQHQPLSVVQGVRLQHAQQITFASQTLHCHTNCSGVKLTCLTKLHYR